MRYLLYPISIIYGCITILRNWFFDYKIIKSNVFSIPIICVGNLSIGGTGKTPHIDYIINLLKKEYNIVMLSRGYKRKSKGFMYVEKNGSPYKYGDEAILLKNKYSDIIIAVDNNRSAGIQKILIDYPKTNVILLDDGFQHRKVKAGLYILLTEFKKPYFEDHLLPFGRLRENKKEAKRADIIIISKCPTKLTASTKNKILEKLNKKPNQDVFFSNIIYNKWYSLTKESYVNNFYKYKIILITGVANTYSIINFLKNQDHEVYHIKYNDHHHYNINDIQRILDIHKKEKNQYKIILTTEKDAVKLKSFISKFKGINIYVCPIEININESYTFDKKIINYVKSN